MEVIDFSDDIINLQTCTSFETFEYNKSSVRSLFWFGLMSWLLPFTFYRTLDRIHYFRFYGEERESSPLSLIWEFPVQSEHHNANTRAWYEIMFIMAGIHLPGTVIGLLGLSGIAQGLFSWYFEHWLSNLLIPGLIAGAYSLYVAAVLDFGEEENIDLSGSTFADLG